VPSYVKLHHEGPLRGFFVVDEQLNEALTVITESNPLPNIGNEDIDVPSP